MTSYDTPLVIATIAWVYIMWTSLLPIFSMPIAKIKREFALVILSTGTIALIIEWLTRSDMHIVSAISLGMYILLSAAIAYLLSKMDYYVEEVLQELFVLAMSAAGIGITTSIWYWGIDRLGSLILLRILVVLIPMVIFGISWLIARQRYSMWSAGIFVALLLVKWLSFPLWGVWTIVLLMLYSTLVGYVVNWMSTTTYAEKVLAWNIAPAKVWSLLVLSAGMLVLFF